MADYRLPSLGADMDKATLVEWRVSPGDKVKKGEVVALIETSKSAMDIEFFEDGVIEEILVEPGSQVEVGTPIARFQPAGAAPPSMAAEPTAAEPTVAPETVVAPEPVVAPAEAPAPAPEFSDGYKRIHPPVRRLAEQLGVDLATVVGSGPGGRVLRADVEAAAEQRPAAAAAAPPAERPAPAAAPAASPRARRLAEEHGLDLALATPTGADGVITGEDIERLLVAQAAAAEGPTEKEAPAAAPPPEPALAREGEATEADRARERRLAMRRAIADLMARSKREIPHYYLVREIDFERTLGWLEAENIRRAVQDRLLPAVLLIKSVALALREIPEMNGFWIDDHFQPGEGIHTGIAISLREGGLIAPAIHDADQKSLDELMPALRDLVTRARGGVLRRPEMTDPTITITNLGDQGVDAVYGVIYPPQVALVGFGRVEERPWAEAGMVGARRVLTATLSADHRNSDGHRGAIFLSTIERLLKEPEKL